MGQARGPSNDTDEIAFWRNIRGLYRHAGRYVRQYVAWKIRLDPIYRRIDDLVPPAGDILDLGCGYGIMSHILAARWPARRVVGIDFDVDKIGVAGRVGADGNPRFEVADLRTWPGRPADCVLLIDLLHYWQPAGQERIIAAACRCLGAGGTAILREGCRSRSWGHRMVALGERFTTWTSLNRRGDGLYFQPETWYVETFGRHGLCLRRRIKRLGPGSNVVMVFRRAQMRLSNSCSNASSLWASGTCEW